MIKHSLLSCSIFDRDGIIRGSDYRRYSLQANLTQAISSKLSANFSGVLTRVKSNAQNRQVTGADH